MKKKSLHWILVLIIFLLATWGLSTKSAEGYLGTVHSWVIPDTDYPGICGLAGEVLRNGYPNAEILNATDMYFGWVGWGAWYEDEEDIVWDLGDAFPGLTTSTHFWDADSGPLYLSNLSPLFPDVPNAFMKAANLWDHAVWRYKNGDKDGAYAYLGHIAHLMGDMSVPAHAHVDNHVEGDTYEDTVNLSWWWVVDNLDKSQFGGPFNPDPNGCSMEDPDCGFIDIPYNIPINKSYPTGYEISMHLFVSDPNIIATSHPWLYLNPGSLSPGFIAEYFPLYYLMYTTNQRADFFASDDYWGDPIDNSLWGGWITDWSFIDPDMGYYQIGGTLGHAIFQCNTCGDLFFSSPIPYECPNGHYNNFELVAPSLIIASQYTVPYVTRAVATLYQIFGKRVDDPSMNAPPQILNLVDSTIEEGFTYNSGGSFIDPDAQYQPPMAYWAPADNWTGEVDYGDGWGVQGLPLNSDNTFALNHTYADQGSYTITVTIIDSEGEVGTDTAVITVNNMPPIADAGPDQTASAGPDCTATVSLDGSGSSDPGEDPLAYTWTWDGNIATGVSPTILLPVGTTIITLVVNDGIEDSAPDTVTITVTDGAPPGMSLSASPQSLWPPNHKMVPVTIAVSTFDNCDPESICQIISVESNEPVNGSCDGNKAPDWEITGDLTVDLRAERSGCGSGRVYTIQVQCTDAADNSSVDTVAVYVPHDQGDRPDLNDDDGDGYSEIQGDCNDNDKTIYPGAEEICGDGIDQNCNGRDLPCGDDPDEDGVANDQDSCPDSDLRETVVIEGCDSGVANTVLSNGCTISDEIAKCGTDSRNHGQYVSCVSHLTNDLKHDGVLTGREKGAIQSCVASDDDIDGVPDPAEQGPQGNDPNYDGNKDGMSDSQQGNVVSCHTHDRKHYVTMACSEPISDAAAVEKPSAAGFPSGVEFPYGFFEFAIHVLNPGDATKMTLYLPIGANPTTYYKYGPTPDDPSDHWYEFMYDAQTLTGAEINGNVVTLHFVDSQRGDDDLTANGTIVDQGGPGFTSNSSSSTPSYSGSSGCFIATAAYGS